MLWPTQFDVVKLPLCFLLRAQAHPKPIHPSTPPSIQPSIQELWFSSHLHIPFGFMENTPRLSQARLSFAYIHLLLPCTGCRRTLETCYSPCLPWKVGWFSALRFRSLSFPPWQDSVCVCVCVYMHVGERCQGPLQWSPPASMLSCFPWISNSSCCNKEISKS